MNNSQGKFIVIEGLDGAGKSTQLNLLAEHLEKEGYKVEKIDFPQYGKKSAGLVEEYLNGRYGSSEDVGPYKASVFYACDRYDASFNIRQWLEDGKMVICDRYIASNMGHQGGKIKDEKEREEYLKWLYDFEYGLLKIPKPDLNIILKTSPELSMKMANNINDKVKKAKRETYLGDSTIQDLHEKNEQHLVNALASYLKLVEEYPKEFRIVECIENGDLLSIDTVKDKVWELIKEVL